MANSSRDKTLYAKYASAMKSILKNQDEKEIYEGLSRGKNQYLRLDRVETSSFDSSWIDKIEGVIFDLGEIIKTPRENTKSVSDLTPVELAKKINGESVQHLASHTQYIKEVDDYGNVIPSKILSFSNEDNIFTYENRFIATFIRKLMLFVEKRYEFALHFARLHDEEVLYLKNHSSIGPSEIEIETKVKVKSLSNTEVSEANNAYFDRLSEIRNYVLYYYNSPFMRRFKTEHNVRNPILQTNIIRKNQKYHHCYEVYRYIESYSQLGVSYRMDEQYSLFSQEELKELNFSLLGSYLALQGKDKSSKTKGTIKEYKPRILTSLDDEEFIYGPYLKGPVEFVRVDEGYRHYLERLLNRELPLHPTKKEREYYADQYQDKRDLKEFDKEKAALLSRKEKEARHFDKAAEKIVAEREDARIALEKQEKDIIFKEETDLLNRIRAEIVAAAHEAWDDQLLEYEEEVGEAMDIPTQDKPKEEEAPKDFVPDAHEAKSDILQRLREVRERAKSKASTFASKTRRKGKKKEAAQEEPKQDASVEAVEPVPEENKSVEEVQVVLPAEEPQEAIAPVMQSEAVAAIEAQPEAIPVEEPVVVEPVEETSAESANGSDSTKEPKDGQDAQEASEPESSEEEKAEEPVNAEDSPVLETVSPVTEEPVEEQTSEAPKEAESPVEDSLDEEPIAEAIVDEKPAEEASTDELPVEPEPIAENELPAEPAIEPKPKENKNPQQKKARPVLEFNPKKQNKPAPKVEPKPNKKKEKKVREAIPGAFIVKTLNGYFVNEHTYSIHKEEAHIFYDYNLAHDTKKRHGGKVVKL